MLTEPATDRRDINLVRYVSLTEPRRPLSLSLQVVGIRFPNENPPQAGFPAPYAGDKKF